MNRPAPVRPLECSGLGLFVSAFHALAIGAALTLLLAAATAHADSDLQLSYRVEATPSTSTAPVARALAETDTPLRLEYELSDRIERMTQTTRELRAIVDTMPGPGLTANEATSTSPQKFASPLDETLARLHHVEQLIADIGRIISAMPPGQKIASIQTDAVPVAKTLPTRPVPVPPPAPAPPDPLLTSTTLRAMFLIGGGLCAAILARYLRQRFLRRRPSAKQLAATIEPPPLKDEAIELADVMASMGLADGAAQALVERIRANPRQSLSHWLKLLDVYRQSGQQQQFEQATEEIRTAFNVQPGSWDKKQDGKTSLENYPHIATQLKKLWPTPECAEYLLSLLADNRDGKRAGFPLPVVEEIVLLLALLRSES